MRRVGVLNCGEVLRSREDVTCRRATSGWNRSTFQVRQRSGVLSVPGRDGAGQQVVSRTIDRLAMGTVQVLGAIDSAPTLCRPGNSVS
jgi:hypothetical protein